MNHNLLRYEMAEKGITVRALSEKTGIPESTLYTKLSGKSEFSQSEMAATIDAVELSPERAYAIFFANGVTETQSTQQGGGNQ